MFDMTGLLTVKQAAEYLGITASTLYDWAAQRRVPSVKLRGRCVRFKLSDLEKIIREDEVPALHPIKGW